MLVFLVLTAVTFSLFGFIIGIWADGFEKLQIDPAAHHHAADLPRRQLLFDRLLPPFWQTVTLFNPVVYLISGFRWSFYGIADVSVGVSLGMTLVFLAPVPRRRVVDLQDRLSAEELRRGAAPGADRPEPQVWPSTPHAQMSNSAHGP